jgi:hypothetical protein
MNNWIFIIDTDQYAGNFERELCAYMTGVVGDCDVGDSFAALYNKEMGVKSGQDSTFIDILEQRSDEHGCCRPCATWETKGWLIDGADGAVREEDWDQAKADVKWRENQAAIDQRYYDMYAKMDPNDPGVKAAGWTRESLDKELKRRQKEVDRVKKQKCPRRPPMNSVAIFFEKRPTLELIALMKERAAKFSKAKRSMGGAGDKNFNLIIHGFRLIKETTEQKEESIE